MKKFLCIILTIVMLFSFTILSFAYESETNALEGAAKYTYKYKIEDDENYVIYKNYYNENDQIIYEYSYEIFEYGTSTSQNKYSYDEYGRMTECVGIHWYGLYFEYLDDGESYIQEIRDPKGNAIQRSLVKFVHDDNCDLEFQYYLPEDGDMELCYVTISSENQIAYYMYDNGEKIFMYLDELTYDDNGNVTYKERYQKYEDATELSLENLYVSDIWEYGYDSNGRVRYYVYTNYTADNEEYPYMEYTEFYNYIGETDNFYQTEKLVYYFEEDEGYPTTEYENLYFVISGNISEDNFDDIVEFEDARFELLKKLTIAAAKYNIDGTDYAFYLILGLEYDDTLCLEENLEVIYDFDKRIEKSITLYRIELFKEDSKLLKEEVNEMISDGSMLTGLRKAIDLIANSLGKTISSINLSNIFNLISGFFAKLF